MALKIEVGDVFNELLKKQEAGEPVLFAHGCNSKGVMGSGIAALVKKLYPFAYEGYRQEYADYGLPLGTVGIEGHQGISVQIANVITQKNFGRDGKQYVDYDAVVTGLERVAEYAKSESIPVYLPMIGGGLGGGDTKRLTAIFQAVFHDVDATLYLKED